MKRSFLCGVLPLLMFFPSLVFNQNQLIFQDHVDALNSTEVTKEEDLDCPWQCELTNQAGYVVYSALGSFYIPMFVMLFFYWRIYKAAVRTTKAINQGFRTTKGKFSYKIISRLRQTLSTTREIWVRELRRQASVENVWIISLVTFPIILSSELWVKKMSTS